MNFHIHRKRLASWFFVLLILLPSCSSSILISSFPSEADVFADGKYIGQTPIVHRDDKASGSILDVRIAKEGFADLKTEIEKTGRINWRSFMFCWLLFPLKWIEKYPRGFYGDLQPKSTDYSPLRVEVQTREAVGSNIFVVALENNPCHGSSNSTALEAWHSINGEVSCIGASDPACC